jgi:hypothetical protein
MARGAPAAGASGAAGLTTGAGWRPWAPRLCICEGAMKVVVFPRARFLGGARLAPAMAGGVSGFTGRLTSAARTAWRRAGGGGAANAALGPGPPLGRKAKPARASRVGAGRLAGSAIGAAATAWTDIGTIARCTGAPRAKASAWTTTAARALRSWSIESRRPAPSEMLLITVWLTLAMLTWRT